MALPEELVELLEQLQQFRSGSIESVTLTIEPDWEEADDSIRSARKEITISMVGGGADVRVNQPLSTSADEMSTLLRAAITKELQSAELRYKASKRNIEDLLGRIVALRETIPSPLEELAQQAEAV